MNLDIGLLTVVIGGLVAIVNALTQVIKKVTVDKIPTSLLAIILSQVVTLVAFFAYLSVTGIGFVWYYLVGVIVVGFLVSYAAMFGFDKLKEILNSWQDINDWEQYNIFDENDDDELQD